MYIIISYALAAICAMYTFKAVLFGDTTAVIVSALFAIFFAWSARATQIKHLEEERDRLRAERDAR